MVERGTFSVGIVERLKSFLQSRERTIIGIVGAPGAGKSTFSKHLLSWAANNAISAAVAPMDGFHLSQSELESRGLADRKGAIDTFDGVNYVKLLSAIRAGVSSLSTPVYDRSVEEVSDVEVPVPDDARLIVAEGNYLLVPEDPWLEIPNIVDEIWLVRTAENLRRGRLVRRHIESGKSELDAREWVESVDDVNARYLGQLSRAPDQVVLNSVSGPWRFATETN